MAETKERAAGDVKGRVEESPETLVSCVRPIVKALHRDLELLMVALERASDEVRGGEAVAVESGDENHFDVTDEDLRGLGLTAREIAGAPEIGSWAGEPGPLSGAEFVERVRRDSLRYTW